MLRKKIVVPVIPVTFKPDDALNVPAATDDQAPPAACQVPSPLKKVELEAVPELVRILAIGTPAVPPTLNAASMSGTPDPAPVITTSVLLEALVIASALRVLIICSSYYR
tara:strand:- start:225 stop:554 length:330 start_codon:yes stop_codon:yes gene_type:complete